jgi:hypothetical protein
MHSDPDTLLPRRNLAAALTKLGFVVSEATLATKATRGGGPPYLLFGRKPLYRWGDALEWARWQLSTPARNSAEASEAKHLRTAAKLREAPLV